MKQVPTEGQQILGATTQKVAFVTWHLAYVEKRMKLQQGM
jgi:hypothetical protein